MRIAHFGTFDVANYGDLLFPRLLEWRLGDIADEFVHISPVGGRRIYMDVPVSRSMAEVQHDGLEFGAVVVGGGNILHDNETSLPAYKNVGQVAYSRLWIGAAQLATRQRIPLVVNAPGVPKLPGTAGAPLMRHFASTTDYFAVRDAYSQDLLRSIGVNGTRVVPDTALEIREVFPASAPVNLAVSERLVQLLDERYAVVHVNDRYGGDIASLARKLDEISLSLRAVLVLVAIGPCHGDDAFALRVAAHMESNPVVFDTPKAIEDIAYVISKACAYVGSSMHGFITATSYKVPALIVAKHTAQHKFLGLLSQLDAVDRLFETWESVAEALASERQPRLIAPVDVGPALGRIDDHWTALRSALSAGHEPR
ncbi:polysaccharide pyruvyl transferase family protein [Microbacterium sp. GXF0217]